MKTLDGLDLTQDLLDVAGDGIVTVTLNGAAKRNARSAPVSPA
jgi:hypothetical protein